MALPDGSMVLICPTGTEYSQVGDAFFAAWEVDPFLHLEEITDPAIFSKWYSNVKRVTTLYSVEYDADPSGNFTASSNGIQWRVDSGTLLPVEANTGDHPFPKPRFNAAAIENLYDSSDNFQYVNEEYPTDPYNTGFPFFFIHKDKFYVLSYLELPSDFYDVGVSLTSGAYSVVYEIPGVETRSYTITIDQLFYP